MSALCVVPVTLREANEFVRRLHRHNRPVRGCVFCVGVSNGELRGVAIAGRPVARMLDDGATIEITRVCTDGAPNACSMLYGAARRAARALGYTPGHIITYTLPHELGASLRASGFIFDGEAGKPGRGWGNRPGRAQESIGDDLVGGKWRWVA